MENDLKRICIQITNRQYQSLKDRSSPGKSMSFLIRSALETDEVIKKSNKDLLISNLNDSKQLTKIERLTNEFTLEITNQEYDLFKEDCKTFPNIEFFDLYIIASGYLGNSTLANDDLDEALNIAKVNYYSLIPWINSITSEKRVSKPGAMWILTSVAGDRGRPSNYHYGAAKAALTIFCEGLLHRLHKKPFKIRIIKAGFIYTSMTIGKAPKILCASKKYVAKN